MNGGLWAIVLAGGEGRGLRALTRHLYDEDRPKQYAALVGSRSLLRQTLDRVGRLVPAERTVVVTLASHARFIEAEWRGAPASRVLAQPCDRGTAAAVLLAAHWIQAHDPRAIVVSFPSDHFILEEAAFTRRVADVARFVTEHPDTMVLLGAPPTEPETEYGWIEPGERVGWTVQGPLYRVRRFEEKPSTPMAAALSQAGGLWNTFVLTAAAATLIKAGRDACRISTIGWHGPPRSLARSTSTGRSVTPMRLRPRPISPGRSSSSARFPWPSPGCRG